jgi:hypothetical protein
LRVAREPELVALHDAVSDHADAVGIVVELDRERHEAPLALFREIRVFDDRRDLEEAQEKPLEQVVLFFGGQCSPFSRFFRAVGFEEAVHQREEQSAVRFDVVDALPQVDRASRHAPERGRGDAYRDATAALAAVPAPLAQEVTVLAEARHADVAAHVGIEAIADGFQELDFIGLAGRLEKPRQELAESRNADLELARIVQISDLRHP